jgi:hypothetical protein
MCPGQRSFITGGGGRGPYVVLTRSIRGPYAVLTWSGAKYPSTPRERSIGWRD